MAMLKITDPKKKSTVTKLHDGTPGTVAGLNLKECGHHKLIVIDAQNKEIKVPIHQSRKVQVR